MPRTASSIDKIRAELAWVNETPDSIKCGCHSVRCCEETGHKAGTCTGDEIEEHTRQRDFCFAALANETESPHALGYYRAFCYTPRLSTRYGIFSTGTTFVRVGCAIRKP